MSWFNQNNETLDQYGTKKRLIFQVHYRYVSMQSTKKYLQLLLDEYYPMHYFALFRAHELYNVEPFLSFLETPILDLGCGDGLIASLLFDSQLEYGIDSSEKALYGAKQRDVYKTLYYGDAHDVPLENNVLGGVFSNCVLEHIPDMPGLIREISRILRPGGHFVATCLSPYYYELNPVFHLLDKPGLRALRREMIRRENELHNHVSVFDKQKYEVVFNKHGMSLVDHRYYAPKELTRRSYWWDTLSKYRLPFPTKLRHDGVLFYYRILVHKLGNKRKKIEKWERELHDLCYTIPEQGQVGAAQILVARKE